VTDYRYEDEDYVRWMAGQEIGHLLRNDGVHHGDSRECVMNNSVAQSPPPWLCDKPPDPCVTRINQVR
jgi:hypothetical protein